MTCMTVLYGKCQFDINRFVDYDENLRSRGDLKRSMKSPLKRAQKRFAWRPETIRVSKFTLQWPLEQILYETEIMDHRAFFVLFVASPTAQKRPVITFYSSALCV